jgi:hypothetical protein
MSLSLSLSTRLLRIGIGLVLAPLLVAAAWVLLDLSRLLWTGGAWGHPWFWALAGGFAVWVAVYLALPRPVWVYVLGHELTHALAVYIHAGRVHRFHVSDKGGHIVSNKNNWIIALAPYFLPLYSLLWIGLWWSVNFYWPLGPYAWVLYAGIGVTWGFHLTFTFSMIRDGQSDLTGQGVFFSLVLILLLNLLGIEAGLAAVMDHFSYARLGGMLWHRTADCYAATGRGLWHGADGTAQFLARAWKRGSLF